MLREGEARVGWSPSWSRDRCRARSGYGETPLCLKVSRVITGRGLNEPYVCPSISPTTRAAPVTPQSAGRWCICGERMRL